MAAATIPLTLGASEKEQTINPWLIAITVTLATFMELLDTAIANVSLPHIAGGLATSYDEATWVRLHAFKWLGVLLTAPPERMPLGPIESMTSFTCGLRSRNREVESVDGPGALRDESGHPQRRRCRGELIIEARQWQATPQS